MRSRQLETALTDFVGTAASHLQNEVRAGAEVPFELGSQSGGGGVAATTLYCYRALTGDFIAERDQALRRLPGHAELADLLENFEGLERYLAAAGAEARGSDGPSRAHAAIRALLEDVFEEQTDFELRPERLRGALERLEQSASASAAHLVLVATLHGVAIATPEIALTKGLTIARRDALKGLPRVALVANEQAGSDDHLLVVLTADADDPSEVLPGACDVLQDLLRALRLFGDGRITLGALGWARIGAGGWSPLVVGAGGRAE